MSVEALLFEVGKPEPLAKWTLSKPAAQLLELEQELAARLLASLGIDRPVRRPPPPPKQGSSPTVAVLALRNLGSSHRLDAMQSGFADILQAELAALPGVRLVDRQDLYQVLREQELSLSGLVDPQTAVRVGKLLGAERLVYGLFLEAGESLRLDVRLADTRTATVLRYESVQGPMAEFAGRLAQGEHTLETYLAVVRQGVDIRHEPVPSGWDERRDADNDPRWKVIWGRLHLARMHQKKMNDPKGAALRYQRLLHDQGVIHAAGADAAQALRGLGFDVHVPAKAALVWGGGVRAYAAWAEILRPKGFAVHGVLQNRPGLAHLAPYDLVVLVGAGKGALVPDEALALHGYVATGGSLLVVVSPGWEPAAPSILNSVLAPMGVRAQEEMVVRAESTRLVGHPITRGIAHATAKSAVGLEVPRGTALIDSGQRTLLAAVPYRHGRLVVASFGQWLLPDPRVELARVKKYAWTARLREIPADRLPVEPGPIVQLPLLNRVVDWLIEPHREGGSLGRQRKPFLDAMRISLRAQLGTAPRQEMLSAVDKAADCYRAVAEGMDRGPEKSLALLNLGRCDEMTGKRDEAAARYKAVLSAPDVCFWDSQDAGPVAWWAPLSANGYAGAAETTTEAHRRLVSLGVLAK